MIVIIRIKGLVGMRKKIEETLNRLKLRRKFVCVVVRDKPEIFGMIKKVENFVAYGKIDEATLVELIKKRGKLINKNTENSKEFSVSKTSKKILDKKINASKLKNFDGTQKSEISDVEEIAKEFLESKTDKKLENFGVKPFFRLHPPRGGFNSKLRFPKGILGNHGEKINELIRRML